MSQKHRVPFRSVIQSDSVKAKSTNPEISSDNSKAVISFEYFDRKRQCPSEYPKTHIKELFTTFKKVTERTWKQIRDTGGPHGQSVGLGYETYSDPPINLPPNVSKEERICSVKTTEKGRAFGIRRDSCFYLIEIDRNHLRT